MPEGLDRETGLPVHRAFPDAYVTAHHLRDQLNEAGLAQLLAWSAEPGLLPRVPYGANRGRCWSELADKDLQSYLSDRGEDVRFSAEKEVERRGQCVPRRNSKSAQGKLL